MIRPLRVVLASVLAAALLLSGCGDDDDADGGALSADAGDDFGVAVGEAPEFSGCGSGGEIVNYRWVIVEAPEAMAADVGKVLRETDPGCSFTLEASMIAQEVGTWTVELTVSDASGATSTDTVTVEVTG